MRILLIDNYDSFVFNIVGLLQRCRTEFPGLEWSVVRNDEILPDTSTHYDAIILSPGPGIPSEAGQLIEVIRQHGARLPILGICLGCQAIAEVYGCSLRRLDAPRHGHSSSLTVIDSSDPIVGFLAEKSSRVGRYHSWVIEEASIYESKTPIIISSRDEDGNIMSIRHSYFPVFGLQFHPESIITEHGYQMLKNFLTYIRSHF